MRRVAVWTVLFVGIMAQPHTGLAQETCAQEVEQYLDGLTRKGVGQVTSCLRLEISSQCRSALAQEIVNRSDELILKDALFIPGQRYGTYGVNRAMACSIATAVIEADAAELTEAYFTTLQSVILSDAGTAQQFLSEYLNIAADVEVTALPRERRGIFSPPPTPEEIAERARKEKKVEEFADRFRGLAAYAENASFALNDPVARLGYLNGVCDIDSWNRFLPGNSAVDLKRQDVIASVEAVEAELKQPTYRAEDYQTIELYPTIEHAVSLLLGCLFDPDQQADGALLRGLAAEGGPSEAGIAGSSEWQKLMREDRQKDLDRLLASLESDIPGVVALEPERYVAGLAGTSRIGGVMEADEDRAYRLLVNWIRMRSESEYQKYFSGQEPELLAYFADRGIGGQQDHEVAAQLILHRHRFVDGADPDQGAGFEPGLSFYEQFSKETIMAMQRFLSDYDYYTAGIDGVPGPRFLQAIRNLRKTCTIPLGAGFTYAEWSSATGYTGPCVAEMMLPYPPVVQQ